MENKVEDKQASKQDVMVSNLPLLFSDGNPTSINSMSAVWIIMIHSTETFNNWLFFCLIQEDFQYFIPFLLKCILGCEPSGWAKHAKFKWWPSDVPWSPIILTKKHQTQVGFFNCWFDIVMITFNFSLCRIGETNSKNWWKIAMNIMGVPTCCIFQQNYRPSVVGTGLMITGTVPLQCMIARLASC